MPSDAHGHGEGHGHGHGHGHGGDAHTHGHGEGHGAGAHHGHDGHRFDDPERWAEQWNTPERVAWQQPEQVIAAMGIEPGMTVVDFGTGTGFFVPYLSEAVGPDGHVIAIDVESAMADYVAAAAAEAGLTNVETRVVPPGDSGLADASVDRILVVNVWHHLPAPRGTGHALEFARALDGGTLTVVEYDMEAQPGPPLEMRLAPEAVLAELAEAGFTGEVVARLPRQYVISASMPAP